MAPFVVHISSVHGYEYSSTRFCVLIFDSFLNKIVSEKNRFLMEHLHKKKSNCEKNHSGGRLSFKTQLKIEYLLPYTGSRKVLENIPDLTFSYK